MSYGTTEETKKLLGAGNASHNAFLEKNVEASRAFHQARLDGTLMEQHNAFAAGDLKAAVYGGLDGIMTSIATVLSVVGSNLPPYVLMIISIAHLFSDSLAMGMGDYLGTISENELYEMEYQKEKWEFSVSQQSEIDEMVELYEQRGISKEDATIIWNILAKYPNAFVDIMMAEELHLLPPESENEAIRSATITCLSFMVFGTIPVLPFLLPLININLSEVEQIYSSVILTFVALFLLGALKSQLVAMGSGWVKSALQTSALGGVCALVSYFIGVILQHAFDVPAL